MDGLHYCTKTSPDDFPAPFHKTFHFEMGLEATGGKRVGDTSAGQNGPSASSPVVAPEMLIDYVRIAQVRWLASKQSRALRPNRFPPGCWCVRKDSTRVTPHPLLV